MKKLFYNIYSNISEKQFFKVDKKLNVVQYRMSKILYPDGWQKEPQTDGLGVGFRKKTAKIFGSIGITFDDQPGKLTFSLGILKYFDENNVRYSLRQYIFENEEFDYFEDKTEDFITLALTKYHTWSREDIINLGEKDQLTSYK